MVKATIPVLFVPQIIYSFYVYLFTNNETLLLPYPMWWVYNHLRWINCGTNEMWRLFALMLRFPFDTNTPVGYALAVAVQYQTTTYVLSLPAALLSADIGLFFIITSLTSDIKNSLMMINESVKPKKNRLQTMKQIRELIDFHSNARQFSNLLAVTFFLFLPNEIIHISFSDEFSNLDYWMIFRTTFNHYFSYASHSAWCWYAAQC